MKQYLTTLLVAYICLGTISAQDIKTKRADQFFDALAYDRAAELYEDIAKRDNSAHVLSRLGDSYYYNVEMEEAAKWYGKLIEQYKSEVDPEYIFKYVHALKGIGDYEKADKWMEEFANAKKNDSRAAKFVEKKDYLEDIQNRGARYEINNLSLNSPLSDFGVALYDDDKLIFTSADVNGGGAKKYGWNNQPYLDLFVANVNNEDAFSKSESFFGDVNTKYHEGSVAFSPGKDTLYFTGNNKDKDKNKINNLVLFRASLVNGEWTNVVPMPFNDKDYSVGQPTISKDGKKLYFVSDMSGTLGNTDIFEVTINADGTYGTPVNLGPKINTEGREMFPFMSDKDILYFASDGHLGMGGLDVFAARLRDGAFEEPINVGPPVNGNLDDFGYIINEETKEGYFSSNRKSGKGDDDIYAMTEVVSLYCDHQYITGVAVEKNTKSLLPDATITLYSYKDGQELETDVITTGVDGSFTFKVDRSVGKTYKLVATKEEHEGSEKSITPSKTENMEFVLLELESTKPEIVVDNGRKLINIEEIYFDLNSSYLNAAAKQELDKVVEVMKKYPKMIVELSAHADARGTYEYNQWLSDRRAKRTIDYIVSKGISANRISGKGYGEAKLVTPCPDGVKCPETKHQLNRRSEFVIIEM
ncbi:OmpA family protein [Leptobacterium sp. I13]|uniref:OmpA family protein n=1 Tax=Leptobacterium meishanense TaxID=3128904 RepID=UPI0030EEACA6